MLSLPLAKLSVAQDTDPAQAKFTWQHETQQIFFVLDSYGARDSSQLLKVVQGTQVQQAIELERLINQGHELISSLAGRGVELKAEQLPVSAIVRCPLLAIRWQLPNKKIRRAQLKFKSSEDFDAAYKRLHSLGLRMSAPGGGQAQILPSTASSQQPSSSSTKPGLIPAAYHHDAASGGLSCPPSRLADLAARPYTATNAPTALESQLQEAAHTRPASAFTGYSNEDSSRINPFANPLAPPVYFPRPSSATTDVLGGALGSPLFPPRDQAMPTIEDICSETNERPETAMLYSRPDTAEAVLPPRRELPFQRSSLPRSSGSDSIRPSSRPSTAFMGPPPLPARVASLRPSSSLGLGRDVELSPLPQPTIIGQPMLRPATTQQPPRTPTQDHNPFTPSKTSPCQDTKNQRFSNWPPSSSPLPSQKAGPGLSSTLRPLSPLSGTVQNMRQATFQNDIGTPPASGSPNQNSEGSRNVHALDPNSVDDLAAYAMQSEEGRRAALNEFIFRHLESDDFLALVEDMETCWARVAFGMK